MKGWTSATLAVLGAVLIIVPLTASKTVANAHSFGGTTTDRQTIAQASNPTVVGTAAALGPYIDRAPDGTLTLHVPASVVDRLPTADVADLRIAIVNVNRAIRKGTLQSTSSGAVFNPLTDGFSFQGGWSGHGQDWWHMWLCLSHSDILAMENWGWWTMGGAGLAALTYFAGAIGLAVAVFVGIYGGWMAAADRGNGSCLNIGFWPPPNAWVTSQ